MNLVITILQALLFTLFGLGVIYLLVFAVAGLFRKKMEYENTDFYRKIAVFIPGYKEDNVIIEVAKQALNQNYPSEFFDVIVIADTFNAETLEQLRQLPILVNEVSFEKSSKAKSLNKTMEILTENYDIAIVLDADNIMANDFLNKMNATFNKGFIAVQGHRLAKNMDNHFAILDSLSEEINNHIFRSGHRVIGLSAALIGSGMGFDYRTYKKFMSQIESFGEDKELEHKLLKNKIRIEYLDDALVYDEKVSKSNVFVNQRTRWIANQLNYATQYLGEGIRELFKGNIDFFDKIIQHLLPPRILMLGFLVLINLFSFLFNNSFWIYSWLILLVGCMISLVISVPGKLFTFKVFASIIYLPLSFFLMLISLFKIRNAKKGFVHTTHSFNDNKNKQ
jgi:cellulose synthase/poly-beta-1,6-N-acetylglucosamine synthase-like glycosyltransferase